MKRPIPVTITAILTSIIAACYQFVFVSYAIYSKQDFLPMLAESYPSLPPVLAILVSVALTIAIPLIAMGFFQGNKWARLLWVALVVYALIFDFTYNPPIVMLVQGIYYVITTVCLFLPASNAYFGRKTTN